MIDLLDLRLDGRKMSFTWLALSIFGGKCKNCRQTCAQKIKKQSASALPLCFYLRLFFSRSHSSQNPAENVPTFAHSCSFYDEIGSLIDQLGSPLASSELVHDCIPLLLGHVSVHGAHCEVTLPHLFSQPVHLKFLLLGIQFLFLGINIFNSQFIDLNSLRIC